MRDSTRNKELSREHEEGIPKDYFHYSISFC